MKRAQHSVHHHGTTRWEVALRPPAPSTRGLIGGLCGYTELADGPSRRTEFATSGVVLIFDFEGLRILDDQGSTGRPGGFIAGVADGFTVTEHDGRSSGIQVDLGPLAARRIFGVPMDELSNRVVTFSDVVGAGGRSLCQRLLETPDWDDRFDLVEAFLAERAARTRQAPAFVAYALDRIAHSGGAVDIGGLAKETGYSRKHLIDQFREHVGLPPKRVARLVRFDRVMRYLRDGGRAEWGEIAHRFGYFDQSHLNREFRAFTGTTPTDARRGMAGLEGVFGP